MGFLNKKIVIRLDERADDRRADFEKTIKESANVRRLIDLLKDTAITVANADNFDSAVSEALRLVCQYTGWHVGHAYYVGAAKSADRCPSLMPTRFWYIEHPEQYAPLKQLSDDVILEDCTGLAGRVYTTQHYVLTSLLDDSEFYMPCRAVARDLGFVDAFAFPVIVKNRIHAILQFYSLRRIELDANLLDAVAHIGKLLGDLIENKWAEQALRSSEIKFRSVFETAINGIVLSNERGSIVAVNQACIKMFGYTESEMVGQPLSMLMPERFREAHRAGLTRMITTGEKKLIGNTAELVALHKDGHEFPIELSLGDWKSGVSVFYCGFIRNLTEREDATKKYDKKTEQLESSEESLSQQTRLLYAVLDATDDSVVVIDNKDNLIFINSSAEVTLGHDQLRGDSDTELRTWSSSVDILHGKTREQYPSHETPLHRALLGEKVEKEQVLACNASHPHGILLEVTATPLRSGTDNGIIGAVGIFRTIK